MKNLFKFIAKYHLEFDYENQAEFFNQLAKVDNIEYSVIFNHATRRIYLQLIAGVTDTPLGDEIVATVDFDGFEELPFIKENYYLSTIIYKGEF